MTETARPRSPTDDRLAASLRLASQMSALSGLYPGVVHDLRSPLNALVVNLELLKASISDDPDVERQERYVRILDEELMRLNDAIDRLLPAAAPPRDERGPFDLGEVVREVQALLAPQARHQRVAIEIDAPAEPLVLEGWRDRLKQALLAIAVNGLEAMPEGGTLAISAAPAPGGAILSVVDTGPGIPEALGERAFDLYASTKDGHGGLGLFVARQVVESVSGTLKHSPARDRGCRFDLALPLAPKTIEER